MTSSGQSRTQTNIGTLLSKCSSLPVESRPFLPIWALSPGLQIWRRSFLRPRNWYLQRPNFTKRHKSSPVFHDDLVFPPPIASAIRTHFLSSTLWDITFFTLFSDHSTGTWFESQVTIFDYNSFPFKFILIEGYANFQSQRVHWAKIRYFLSVGYTVNLGYFWFSGNRSLFQNLSPSYIIFLFQIKY